VRRKLKNVKQVFCAPLQAGLGEDDDATLEEPVAPQLDRIVEIVASTALEPSNADDAPVLDQQEDNTEEPGTQLDNMLQGNCKVLWDLFFDCIPMVSSSVFTANEVSVQQSKSVGLGCKRYDCHRVLLHVSNTVWKTVAAQISQLIARIAENIVRICNWGV
jgi:hypothetical protein